MRLFLALELPGEIRRLLGELQARLRPRCPGWRWLRPEGIHLTLRFLGEVPPEADHRHREAWREAAAGGTPMRLHIREVGVFPGPSRPRILWAGVGGEEPAGALAALASALEESARREGFPPEHRPFRPHLTIARAADRRGRPVPPPGDSLPPAAEFDATEVVLFRSELHPAGARYTRLDEFPLGSRGDGD